MIIVAIDGSPIGSGRTETVLRSVLAGAESEGADCRLLSIRNHEREPADACRGADAFVVGSPVYRGSYSSPLKSFLDDLPRGMWGEREAPITARSVALVLTGATWHHFKALDDLRNVLSGFFAAHVLSPGLYVPQSGFNASKELDSNFAAIAEAQGRTLVSFANAIEASPNLQSVKPQA